MAENRFGVTWEYRCPFARNVHEHLVDALEAGAPWDVTFLAFSLTQAHTHEGEVPVWDDPSKAPDLLALAAGVVVREQQPDRFFDAHRALFAARHDAGGDLREEAVVAGALRDAGLKVDEVLREVHEGWPIRTIQKEHEEAVHQHHIFGVPTFVVGDKAVFVRVMTRPQGDAKTARRTIEGVLDLMVERPELNEFKYTKIAR